MAQRRRVYCLGCPRPLSRGWDLARLSTQVGQSLPMGRLTAHLVAGPVQRQRYASKALHPPLHADNGGLGLGATSTIHTKYAV